MRRKSLAQVSSSMIRFLVMGIYPRNLVKLPQNTVVIDWEYRQGFRACFLDYVPNVLASLLCTCLTTIRGEPNLFVTRVIPLRVGTDDLRRAIEQGSLLVRVQAARFASSSDEAL